MIIFPVLCLAGLALADIILLTVMMSWMIWGPIAAFRAHKAIVATRERGESVEFLMIEQRNCLCFLAKGSQYAIIERSMGAVVGLTGLVFTPILLGLTGRIIEIFSLIGAS